MTTDMHGIASRIESAADVVQRLSPHHTDPHRFHEDKSEVVADLREIARDACVIADAAPLPDTRDHAPSPRRVLPQVTRRYRTA